MGDCRIGSLCSGADVRLMSPADSMLLGVADALVAADA